MSEQRYALISVSDKTDIVYLARQLIQLDFKIISTGGTLKILHENKVDVIPVSQYTGVPEMFDGRVKTLHPKIHSAILWDRGNSLHQKEQQHYNINSIDLVVVNLYPFEDVLNAGGNEHELIENIDIGGPCLLRAAAKNNKYCLPVCDSKDYKEVLSLLREGHIHFSIRKKFAQKVFAHTSHYDRLIADYMLESMEKNSKDPEIYQYVTQEWQLTKNLRYGENPQQEAKLYHPRKKNQEKFFPKPITGKELSYNNYLDLEACYNTISLFKEPTCVLLKHNNPCGVASGNTFQEAFQKAYECDTVSPFGGFLAFNQPFEKEDFDSIKNLFLEGLLIPSISSDAIKIFQKKKPLLRICLFPQEHYCGNKFKSVFGGMLIQNQDQVTHKDWKLVTEQTLTDDLQNELEFAWKVVSQVRSNAIVITQNKQTIGIGAGQMSRVKSVQIALEQAQDKMNHAVLASDAFFPFRDSIDLLAQYNIKAIIQPGGSKRDPEVIQACNENNISMVFTNRRHFCH